MVLMGHKVITWYFSQRALNKMHIEGEKGKEAVTAPVKEEEVEEESKCPLCTKDIRNPTMIRTTGYVYCYDCIDEYVRREKKCPMSQLAASEDSLQVLYN